MRASSPDPISAALLSVGSELLLGETVDTNAAFLGQELAALGLPATSGRLVPDDRAAIRDAFADAVARARLVVATGGLGPTHDDLTREGLADALGEGLAEDPDLLATLETRFASHGRMPATNRRQATLIPSAEAVPNPIGSAPGWWVEARGAVVVLMPGVPSEMRRMWADEVRPRLVARFDATPLAIRTVKCFGVGESAVAERLGELLDAPGEGVDAGIYARDDGVHVRFSTRGDATHLDALVQRTLEIMGVDAYGTDHATLPSAALRRLSSLGAASLASIESGTAGALLSVLAEAGDVAGGARYAGGALRVEGSIPAPDADVLLDVELLLQDGTGRSRVRVRLHGAASMPETELRIHGSGPQRLRRAAFAALDAVRRL